jgi:hypothetical protein
MNHNMRSVLLAIIMVAFIGLNLVPFAAAQEAEIVLGADQDAPSQRPSVVFTHELHMELLECLACHHAYEDGVNVLDEDELVEGNPAIRCAACHNDQADLERQEAYHRQCIGCHIETRKADAASGPEMCGACHRPAP